MGFSCGVTDILISFIHTVSLIILKCLFLYMCKNAASMNEVVGSFCVPSTICVFMSFFLDKIEVKEGKKAL